MQTLHKAFVSLLGTALALTVGGRGLSGRLGSGCRLRDDRREVPGDKQWQKNKDMPYGMRIMYLSGDPSKPGPYVYRIRVPTGYKIPPVKYPDDRVTTILKGIMWNAEGERYDPMKMQELGAGTMFVTPANTPHYPVGADRADPRGRRVRPDRQCGDLHQSRRRSPHAVAECICSTKGGAAAAALRVLEHRRPDSDQDKPRPGAD